MRLTSYHFSYTQDVELNKLFKYSISFHFDGVNDQDMKILNAFAQGLKLQEPVLMPYKKIEMLYAVYYADDIDILKRLINVIEYTYTK